MTSIFTATGDRSPVTAVHAGPCVVLDKITPDKNGYAAVKLGFGEKLLAHEEAGARPVHQGRRPAAALRPRGSSSRPPISRSSKWASRSRSATVFSPLTYIDVERHVQGQGLPGRHEAPPHARLPRHARYARVLPSRRLDRLPPDPRPRPQGQAHGRSHGRRQDARCRTWCSSRSTSRTEPPPGPGLDPGRASNGFVVVRNAKKKAGMKVKLKGQAEAEEKSKNPMKASKAGARHGQAEAGQEVALRSEPSRQMSKLGDRSHRHDVFHRRAKQQGFVARSVFKLEEIDQKHQLLRRARACSTSAAGRARGCSTRAHGRPGRRAGRHRPHAARSGDPRAPHPRRRRLHRRHRRAQGPLDGFDVVHVGHGAGHDRRALARPGALGGAVRARAGDRRADAGAEAATSSASCSRGPTGSG